MKLGWVWCDLRRNGLRPLDTRGSPVSHLSLSADRAARTSTSGLQPLLPTWVAAGGAMADPVDGYP